MSLGNEYLFTSENGRAGTAPSLRVRLRTFQIPPIGDGAVIGRQSPVNRAAMQKVLRLLAREPFAGIDLRDPTVASILVRKSVLRKIGWETVKNLVLRNIKPLMTKTEILALRLEVEIALGDNY